MEKGADGRIRRQKLEELHADAYMSIDAIKALPCCAIGEQTAEAFTHLGKGNACLLEIEYERCILESDRFLAFVGSDLADHSH